MTSTVIDSLIKYDVPVLMAKKKIQNKYKINIGNKHHWNGACHLSSTMIRRPR